MSALLLVHIIYIVIITVVPPRLCALCLLDELLRPCLGQERSKAAYKKTSDDLDAPVLAVRQIKV